jgi:hypothetical protein
MVRVKEGCDVAKIRFLMTCVSLAAAVQVVFLQVSFAQAPPSPPAVPGAAPAAAPGAAPYDAYPPPRLQEPMSAPPASGPVVTLRADNPRARLQQMQLRWRDVCTSPCGVPVDPAGTYRIGGGTVRPSLEFRMPRPSGPVLIDTQTGSTVKHWVGFGLAIGGGVSALAGVLFLALASSASSNSALGPSAKDVATIYGVTYLVIGGILMAVGIPLSMSSTSVTVR